MGVKQWKPRKMVGWYDPRQLVRTGIRVLSADLFTKNADARVLQTILEKDHQPFRLWADRDRVTVDYIADTGDGFDSTYAVGYWATEPDLRLVDRSSAGGSATTQPGEILILGGDQVYPTAGTAEYDERFCKPFEMASAELTGERHLFAVPGNHDWYDNLVAFSHLFLAERRIGRWRTSQHRSYFALQLPHRWWILGTDCQLGSEIDEDQFHYFEQLAKKEFRPGDSVILCVAEPHWVFENETIADRTERPLPGARLRELEDMLDRAGRLRVVIAGDLHHYRRHSYQRLCQERVLLTCGGGGAFLHPTHGWRDKPSAQVAEDKKTGHHDPPPPTESDLLASSHLGAKSPEPPGYLEGLALERSYPSVETSRRIAWRNLGFPLRNGYFMLASGAVYGIIALNLFLAARALPSRQLPFFTMIVEPTVAPALLAWVSVLIVGVLAFTDTSKWKYRLFAGSLHGFAHAFAALLIPYGALSLSPAWLTGASCPPQYLPLLVGVLLAVAALGGFVGAFIMGVYLLVSLNWAGRHRNESFSALRESGHKNFIRMTVDKDGLLLRAVGVDEVPTRWDPDAAEAGAANDRAIASAKLARRMANLPSRNRPGHVHAHEEHDPPMSTGTKPPEPTLIRTRPAEAIAVGSPKHPFLIETIRFHQDGTYTVDDPCNPNDDRA